MQTNNLAFDPLAVAAEHDKNPGTLPGLKATDRAVREEIQHRAYAIWQSEGRPAERDLANWLEAEAKVLATT